MVPSVGGTAGPSISVSVASASTMLDSASRCACMDPQRRKLLPYAFYQSVDGYTTLQCSGTLYVAQPASGEEEGEDAAERAGSSRSSSQVHVVCSADVLLPFLGSPAPLELLDDTSISILPYASSASSWSAPSSPDSSATSPTSRWWLCDLLRCDDVPGVQAAIDQLTHQSNEWAVGWQAHPLSTAASITPSSSSTATVSRRPRSAATFAVLRVRQPLNPKQYRSTTLAPPAASLPLPTSSSLNISSSHAAPTPVGFPSFPPLTFLSSRSLRRGCDVHVIASPYGLLSPAVFHNSVSGGIVSNVVSPSSATAAGSDSSVMLSDGDASFDSVMMRDTVSIAQTSFPSADVSFPRHLHFPIQGHPTSSAVSARAGAAVEARPIASVFLTDCRCLPGSEGGPVVLSLSASPSASASSVLLAGLVTLPLHLTNALSPVLLNNVVSAEAIWHWLYQDERTVPHPCFHALAPPPTVAVVSPLTSSTAVSSAFLPSALAGNSASKTTASSSLSVYPVSASYVKVGGMVERAERSLAIAKVESSWASAIVLTADGYIATNAHLLAPFHTASTTATTEEHSTSAPVPLLSAAVSVCLPSSTRYPQRSRRWYKATVVYICRSPWDLAVLKIDPPSPLTPVVLPLPSAEPGRPGDTVYVLGHALFSPSSMLLPTLTRGVLSQCVSLPLSESSPASPPSTTSRSPVLLQTDSAVHNGNSGGLLLSHSGLCLGMVTSNIQHTALPTAPDLPTPPTTANLPPSSTTPSHSSSVIIPQLNLSIPAAVLHRVRARLQQHSVSDNNDGSELSGGDVWREWEAGESAWRAAVEQMWGLSVVDVWEVDVKPRSSKYRQVVDMVQRIEREKHDQHLQRQQQNPQLPEQQERRAQSKEDNPEEAAHRRARL